jgi:ferredoxin
VIGRERLGIVPSPQTMEAEVMQAFFMSNKVAVLSERYSGQERGLPSVHPYFPYPKNEPMGEKAETPKHILLSALGLSEEGNLYLEKEESDAYKDAKEPFVIITVDRIFPEKDLEKVIKLMGISSGSQIKAHKVPAKGNVILFDNGRLALSRSDQSELLKCINCYACSLYCPVYLTIGGLFGAPMMAAIGSLSVGYQSGIKSAVNRGLYYCTLCGKCEFECPTDVPIAELVGKLRKKARFTGF